MTFNKRTDNYALTVNYTPFIEDNINFQLKELQDNFLKFNKNYEDLKDFNSRLTKMSLQEYTKVKPQMHDKITSTPALLNNIRGITNQITSADIKDTKLKTKAYEQIKIVDDKIISKNNELPKIINDIVEKERLLLGKANFDSEVTRMNVDENLSTGNNYSDNFDIRESKIILKEVKDNKEYLERREKELEDIKKISSQVMSITMAMSTEVKKQGEALGGIEDNVVHVKDNALKAESEIKEAEKGSRYASRRIFWLFIFLCFFVISIIVIIILIFLPSEEKKFLL